MRQSPVRAGYFPKKTSGGHRGREASWASVFGLDIGLLWHQTTTNTVPTMLEKKALSEVERGEAEGGRVSEGVLKSGNSKQGNLSGS